MSSARSGRQAAGWLAARTPVPTSPKSKRRVSAGLFLRSSTEVTRRLGASWPWLYLIWQQIEGRPLLPKGDAKTLTSASVGKQLLILSSAASRVEQPTTYSPRWVEPSGA